MWHLHAKQWSSCLTAWVKQGTRSEVVSTQGCFGLTLDLQHRIFFSMLSKIWKSFGKNSLTCREQCESEEYLGILLVTSWPTEWTGQVAEAMLLALQIVPLHRCGSWDGGRPSIILKWKWQLGSSNTEQDTLGHWWQANREYSRDHVQWLGHVSSLQKARKSTLQA